MALYVWKCDKCGYVTRRILPKRPVLHTCSNNVLKDSGFTNAGSVLLDGPCGGTLYFDTNSTSSTKEIIDNGLMYKAIERDPNIEAQLKERNDLAEKEDDKLV